MFSSETDESLIMLITIFDPENKSVPILRITDGCDLRLGAYTTDTDIIYGVHSRGNDFIFIPLEVGLPGEQDTGIGACRITINYVTKEAITLVRSSLNKPANVLIELVLSSSPDTVEAVFAGFQITSVSYNSQSITLDLTMVNLAREPFPCYNFIPSYFPGLF